MTNIVKNSRIEYLDAIRGFMILWVVLFHLGERVPSWLTPDYRMPLFFLVSGYFFRLSSFRGFFKKKIKSILIPLVLYYVLSAIFLFFKYKIVAQYISSFEIIGLENLNDSFISFLKLFHISNTSLHAPFEEVNVSLWFLIALFNIQMLFYGLNRLITNKYIILFLCLCFHVFGSYMHSIGVNGLFYMSLSFQYLLYYSIGSILGSSIIKYTSDVRCYKFIVPISILLLVVPTFKYESVFYYFRFVAFSLLIYILFYSIRKSSINSFFSFMGRHTLVIFATHILVMSVLQTIVCKLLPLYNINIVSSSGLDLALIYILTCIICTILSVVATKYTPALVGK